MKTPLLLLSALLLLAGRLPGQTPVHARIGLPYMSPSEAATAAADLDAGFLFWLESAAGPRKLFVTTGDMQGYAPINPDPEPVANWHLYPAQSAVAMQGHPLVFDNRYRLSGDNTVSTWSASGTALIRVFGGSLNVKIESITFDAATDTIILQLDTGAPNTVPTVEYSLSLTAVPQVWTEVESYTLTPAQSGADGRVTATIPKHQGSPLNHAPYYRITVPSAAAPSIELRATTSIAGNLTVSGAVTGSNTVQIGGGAPAASNSPGTAGTMIQAGNYLYICIAPNTWRRTPLLDWE